MGPLAIAIIVVVLIELFILFRSIKSIGPTEIGLVTKKVSFKKLSSGIRSPPS